MRPATSLAALLAAAVAFGVAPTALAHATQPTSAEAPSAASPALPLRPISSSL